jgi:glycosyltransferase involved in cell wall biosynthesis
MVLIVEPVGSHGGMEFLNHALCAALARAGWHPRLLTSEAMEAPDDSYEVNKVYAGVYGPEPKLRRGLRFLRASVIGFWQGRKAGARLAHFHFFHIGLLQVASVLWARVFGLRVVVSAHDVGSLRAGESPWLLKLVYKISGPVIAYSKGARRKLETALNVPPERIFDVPLGNYDGFLPPLPAKAGAKASFGYDENDFVVLFFGQLKRVKRLDLLLQASALARERGASRLRVLIAGSLADSDSGALADLINSNGLADAVQLHARFIDNEDLPTYFAAADIAALPYDVIYQSGVVLLAMTNGVPVLTSDIPGMREVVEHENNGLTFEAGNPDSLAATLVALTEGRWDLSALSSAARHAVTTRHGWQNCAELTGAAYRAAMR